MRESTSITLLFRGVSRANGSNAPSWLSYSTGLTLRDREHGWYSTRREDVLHLAVAGWRDAGSEPGQEEVQAIIDAVQAIDHRANSREGQGFIVALPGFAEEQNDPVLGARMDAERIRIMRGLTREIHVGTGAVSIGAMHAAPTREVPEAIHGHLYATRRRVEAGPRLTREDVEAFSSPGRVSRFLRDLRQQLEREYNALAARFGLAKRWSAARQRDLYAAMNAELKARGYAPLEVPRPTTHEGPAITRLRRALAAGEAPLWRDDGAQRHALMVILHNDRVRAENALVHERNAEYLLSLGGRAAPETELSRLLQELAADPALSGVYNNKETVLDLAHDLAQVEELSLTFHRPLSLGRS